MTEPNRQSGENEERIIEIEIERLRPFKEHPFQVKDDKEMFLLQESIEKYGILNPLMCLSSSVAGHPLRPARDRRLGEPLPHLLANPIWAHLMARGPKVPLFGLATLCGISYRFQ